MSCPRTSGMAFALALVAASCGGSGGGKASCGLERGACRPDSERVDLTVPTFSHPVDARNPLYPASGLNQVIQLGPGSRIESTRLPQTKPVTWNGARVETVVTQFVSYNGRRIEEVALDYVAQGDDGSVWYFGETVSNYSKGVVTTNSGTWLAGEDGPPGMLMPAHPKVGDVFRPENIPGTVFEEDTVVRTDDVVDGPRGNVGRAVAVKERLMEAGEEEEKTYGPGYGEMRTRAEDEHLDLAVAVPIDARPGPVPADLAATSAGAASLFDAARTADWVTASSAVTSMTDAANRYHAAGSPPLLESQLQTVLAEAVGAAAARDSDRAAQAAVDAIRAALDLETPYSAVPDVDLGRMDAWAKQIVLDAHAKNTESVASDVAIEEAILARTAHAIGPAIRPRVDDALRQLRRAADGGNVTAAGEAATGLQKVLASERLGR